MTDNDTLTFDALHQALTRCMAEHPPTGQELRLHVDANRMAGLWAEMNLARTPQVRRSDVELAVLDAYARWR